MCDPAAFLCALPHVTCAREPPVGVHEFAALLRRDASAGCDSQNAVMTVKPPDIDEHLISATLVHLCITLCWTHDEIHGLEPPGEWECNATGG